MRNVAHWKSVNTTRFRIFWNPPFFEQAIKCIELFGVSMRRTYALSCSQR
jgi:hypothetical protein